MHKFEMPQWAIERVLERRSPMHLHDDLDPRRTALIIVDLQNGFGSIMPQAPLREPPPFH
jgi:ureidoacrylate peracid hydrolase